MSGQMTICGHALDWVQAWAALGGSIGSDDQGRLVFTIEGPVPDRTAAEHMLATVTGDQSLADNVGRIFLLMLQAEQSKGATLQ